MSAISRELQYLHAHRQVEDSRRLQALWADQAAREMRLNQLPWLARGAAAAVGLGWLAAAGLWWNWPAGVMGAVLLAAGWAAGEWRWLPARRSGSLTWDLDRLNPQYEGAFSLLAWWQAAEGSARGQVQAVLEVTLARVDFSRSLVTPDRRSEWRRAAVQLSALGVAAALGLVMLWWSRPARGIEPPTTDRAPMAAAAAPAPQRSAGAPRIDQLRVRIEPPAYTGLPVQENFLPSISAPVGSKITVWWQVRGWDAETTVQSWVRQGERRLTSPQPAGTAQWIVADNVPSGAVSIEAQSGTLFARLPLYLQWRDDLAPQVEATVPAKIERDREGVRLTLHVEDDYGLSRLEMVVSTQTPAGAPTTRVEVLALPLVAGQAGFHGQALISGAVLDALRQDRLRVQFKAWDTHTDAAGKPAPNMRATDPADFLVVQPWDNARKPRTLDHKSGIAGDTPQPSNGGQQGDTSQPQTPEDGTGPKMLQKRPDEEAGPQQAQAGGNGGNSSKYSSMAGSQGDRPKDQTDRNGQDNGSQPPQPPPPSADSSQPGDQGGPAGDGAQGPGAGGSSPSTSGAKKRENLPPTGSPPAGADQPSTPPPAGSADKPAGADADASPTPPGGDALKPPAGGDTPKPPSGDGSKPAQGDSPPPGAGGGSHAESRARSGGSQQTDPNSRGNAAADAGVDAQATVSVEDALAYARQHPLGAWQRSAGGDAVRDRIAGQADSGGGGNLVAGNPAGGSRGIQPASTTGTPAEQRNLAAERLRLETRFAERIEQYLLRARRAETSGQ